MQPLRPGDPSYIGEYELTGFLGEGGMGQVYLGKSPLGTWVAVKVIGKSHAGDPEFVKRFRREVSAAMSVSGAYTAPVVNANPDGDPPWLATAFITGPSLLSVVSAGGQLSAGEIWWLAGGLVEALDAVHRCGLIHRDLKPQNIMLASDGPKVIDFGVAKPIPGSPMESAPITFPGGPIGTLAYMSPEQLLGEEVGKKSDVYSLGVVLAHLSTGTAPEERHNSGLSGWGKPEVKMCPAELRDLLEGCLARQPERRPSLSELKWMILDGRRPYPQAMPSFWPEPLASRVRSAEDEAKRGLPGDRGSANGGSGGGIPSLGARPDPRRTGPARGGGAGGYEPTVTVNRPRPTRPKRVPLEDQLFAAYRPKISGRGLSRPGEALNAAAHALAGERHWDLSRYTAAEDAYLASLGLDPADPVVHVDLGRTQCKQRRYGDAERAFFNALRIDSELIAAHWNLYLAVKLGGGRDIAAAENHYQLEQACHDVLELDPYSAAEHANRGDALYCLGRGDEAVSAYQAALALDPGNRRLLDKLSYATTGT
jgi:hypothetical protein